MNWGDAIAWTGGGALAGGAVGYLWQQARQAVLSERVAQLMRQLEEGKSTLTRADDQRRALTAELKREGELRAMYETRLADLERSSEEKQILFEQAEARLADAFRALSAESLRLNNQQFLELAETAFQRLQEAARTDLAGRQQAVGEMLDPIRQSLEGVDRQIREVERARVDSYRSLHEHVGHLQDANLRLAKEAADLGRALRAPAFRGTWGEVQLRRIAELAGMLEHCDFEEQVGLGGAEGSRRPDLIIRLPDQRAVIVDAKAPLTAWLEAQEAADEPARLRKLKDHANRLRAHCNTLSGREYWALVEEAPEFVVLFLPADGLLSGALEADPELFDAAIRRRVILATPSTLIAMLKAIAYGWKQEKLARNARELSALGRDLHGKIALVIEELAAAGALLEKAIVSYRRAARAVESDLGATAKKLEELGAEGEPVRRSAGLPGGSSETRA